MTSEIHKLHAAKEDAERALYVELVAVYGYVLAKEARNWPLDAHADYPNVVSAYAALAGAHVAWKTACLATGAA